MKGLIWKSFAKFGALLTSLFAICAISLVNTNFAFADSVDTPFTVYWRTYQINTNNIVHQSGYITTETQSAILLTYEAGSYKTLYGFSADFSVSDNTKYTYKVLSADIVLSQGLSDLSDTNSINLEPTPLYLNIDTVSGTTYSGSCTGSRGNPNNSFVTYHCSVSTTKSEVITNAQFVAGNVSSGTPSLPVAIACGTSISPQCNHSIILSDVSYELYGSNSAESEQLNAISEQTTAINNTLQQQQQQDQQDRDDMQNATDDSQTASNEAQAENEAVTSNLLDIMGSFINVLHTSATDCKINVNTGNLNFNEIDFCQGKPAQLTPIINIACSLVLVPVGYIMAKWLIERFLAVTVFGQGGERGK